MGLMPPPFEFEVADVTLLSVTESATEWPTNIVLKPSSWYTHHLISPISVATTEEVGGEVEEVESTRSGVRARGVVALHALLETRKRERDEAMEAARLLSPEERAKAEKDARAAYARLGWREELMDDSFSTGTPFVFGT